MLKNQGIKERIIRREVERKKWEITFFWVIQHVGRLPKLNDGSPVKLWEGKVQYFFKGLTIPPIPLASFKESLLT